MMTTIVRSSLLALFLLWGSGANAAERDVGLGTAGELAFGGLPPCLEENFATARDKCLPAKAAADAPRGVRAEAFVERAIVLIYLRGWDEARQELDEAIASDPKSLVARHLAARLAMTAYTERSQPEWLARARSYTAKALEMAPDNADVRATAAVVVELTGSPDDAIAAYGKAIALQPNHAFALGQRSMLLASRGKFDAALADFRAAIGASPNDLRLRRERAALFIELDKPRQALDDLNFVLKQYPQDFLAIATRAAVHRKLRDNEAALEDLTSLVYGPKGGMPFATGGDQLAGFLMQRAMVLADLKRHDEAADDMVRAVKLGGKQKILRLQVYLRQNGFAALPLDGAASDAVIAATRACFAELKCRQGLTRDA